jgi:hypothetical protein
MNKKYIVRLSDEERRELVEVINKLKGASQKVKRVQILLKADSDGPNWAHYDPLLWGKDPFAVASFSRAIVRSTNLSGQHSSFMCSK